MLFVRALTVTGVGKEFGVRLFPRVVNVINMDGLNAHGILVTVVLSQRTYQHNEALRGPRYAVATRHQPAPPAPRRPEAPSRVPAPSEIFAPL